MAIACERSRFSISLQLDRELSEFENALLERHLRRCASCRSFAADAARHAAALRAAPLARPEAPVVLPAPRRRTGGRIALGTVAASVAAVAAALHFASVSPPQATTAAPEPSFTALPVSRDDTLGVRRVAVRMPAPDGGAVRGQLGVPV